MLGPNGTTACFILGCGGEFSGKITSKLGDVAITNFWCVDYQEDFSATVPRLDYADRGSTFPGRRQCRRPLLE